MLHVFKLNKQYGYTLIEVMVALSVFMILAFTTGSLLYRSFQTQAHLQTQSIMLNQLKLTISLLDDDFQHFSQPSIFENNPSMKLAFSADTYEINFTRRSVDVRNTNLSRNNLHRITYICNNHKLIRRSYSGTEYKRDVRSFKDTILLSNLHTCKFAYLNSNSKVLNKWYFPEEPQKFPIAVRVTLEFTPAKNMQMLLMLPKVHYG